MSDTPRKKPQRRPQISLSDEVYAELQKIAEIWALPNPDAVVPIMLKRFGDIMHEGIPMFTVSKNPSPFSSAESRVIAFPQAPQEVKAEPESLDPGNAFLGIDF
jgi:hypothetical protein